MDIEDARRLVAAAIAPQGGTWADLGAGRGTFTLALARLLGADGRVIAVERDTGSVRALERLRDAREDGAAAITVVHADFTAQLDLPPLDGVLLANALHFFGADAQVSLLRTVAALAKPGGRVAIVEYDDRPASRWVPYPVSFERLTTLAEAAGLSAPARVGVLPSSYGGSLYSAYMMTGERKG